MSTKLQSGERTILHLATYWHRQAVDEISGKIKTVTTLRSVVACQPHTIFEALSDSIEIVEGLHNDKPIAYSVMFTHGKKLIVVRAETYTTNARHRGREYTPVAMFVIYVWKRG